jgi:outer membrane protein assembly factor BamD
LPPRYMRPGSFDVASGESRFFHGKNCGLVLTPCHLAAMVCPQACLAAQLDKRHCAALPQPLNRGRQKRGSRVALSFVSAFGAHGRRSRAALLLAALVFPFGLSACTGEPDYDLSAYVADTEPADVLYNQGLANLQAGKLNEASRKFEAVERDHPYTEFGRKSKVMIAFTKYRMGDYEDAIKASRQYLQLFPASDDSAYAQYIIGLAYYRQIKDVTRDQKEARGCMAAMQELIDRFPESEYVDDAKEKIIFARDQLAGKEMQVGRYYQERREYIASVTRFKKVVQEYGNTRHVEEALLRLTETYYAMGLAAEAQTAAAVLGNNFPDSPWYKDSYALLQSGGLSPKEVGTNWLTQIGKTLVGA